MINKILRDFFSTVMGSLIRSGGLTGKGGINMGNRRARCYTFLMEF